jgi:hypothetical protein
VGGICHYCARLARYLFGIGIGLERAGRQPCRHPPFGALGQFLDESGYCITSVARKSAHFRPGTGVEIESDTHLPAIDTKMAFTVARLLLGIGQDRVPLLRNPAFPPPGPRSTFLGAIGCFRRRRFLATRPPMGADTLR